MGGYNELRTLVGRVKEIERKLRENSGSPRISHSSIHNGGGISEYDTDGNLVSRVGTQHDGTHGAVDLDGPIPPVPTDPVLESAPVSLTVTWDGHVIDELGGPRPLPLDFQCVQILMSQTNNPPLPEDLRGVITSEAGGDKSLTVAHGTWYVSLRTRAKSGRMSDTTATVTIEVPNTVDVGEIEADIAQAQADAIAALAEAAAAQESADGKNTVWYTTPPADGHTVGDTWFDAANGNRVNRWDGTDWVPEELGTDAFEDLAITNAKIGNLDAGKMTTGEIDADRIGAKSISTEKLLIGSTDNLVDDPNFETLGTSNSVWGDTSPTVIADPTGGRAGGTSLKVVRTGSAQVITSELQWKRVAPSAAYRISAWIKSDVDLPAVSFAALVEDKNSSGATTGRSYAISEAILANTWTFVTSDVLDKTDDDTVAIRPTLVVYASAGGTETLWVDQVTVARAMTGSLVVDGSIIGSNLAADSVSTEQLVAGSVAAESLAGEIVLGSKIATSTAGQRVEFDTDGIRLHAADETVLIDLPTAPGSDPTFKGTVKAEGLTVTKGATFYSEMNEFARDAVINLAEQVGGPSSGPVATPYWESTPLSIYEQAGEIGTFSLNPAQIITAAYDYSNGGLMVVQAVSGGSRIWFYNQDGTTATGKDGNTYFDLEGRTITGVARRANGNTLILYRKESDGGQFLKTWSDVYVNVSSIWESWRWPVLGYNGSDVYAVERDVARSRVDFRRLAVGPAFVSTIEVLEATGPSSPEAFPAFVYYGDADWAPTPVRWVVSHADSHVFRVHGANTGSLIEGAEWKTPVAKGGGFWNPADSRFYTVGKDGYVYKHTSLMWSDADEAAGLGTWHVGQSFIDNAPAGGLHESGLGARTSFEMTKRAGVRFSLADVPFGGGDNDPNGWNLYAKRGPAPSLDFSDMFLQDTGTYLETSSIMTAAPITSGQAALRFGTFPGGAPARLRSERAMPLDSTKPVFEIRGDGSGRWGPFAVTADGTLTYDNDTGWLSCNLSANTTAAFPMRARLMGDKVRVQGRLTRTGAANNQLWFQLPAAIPPPSLPWEVQTYMPANRAYLDSNGDFRTQPATGDPSYLYLNFEYWIG